MPIDPNIALQYKGVEFPDPVNALTKTMQLQNMAAQQQVNALKLRQAGIDTRQNMYTQALSRATTKDQAAAVTRQMFADPVVGPYVSQFGTAEQAVSEIPDKPEDFGNWKLIHSGATPLEVEKLKAGREKTAAQQDIAQQKLQAAQEAAKATEAYRGASLGLQQARLRDLGILPPSPAGAPSANMLDQPVPGGAGAAGTTGAMPPPVPGLSPQEQRKLVAKQAEAAAKSQQAKKDREEGIKQAISTIYDPKTGEDKVEKLISQSTSGSLERFAAEQYGGITGKATTGMTAISALQPIASSLTFDLLQGKLGAGISNEDRNMISRLLGDVANPDIPANARLASWKTAKALLTGKAGLSASAAPNGVTSAAPSATGQFVGFEPNR